MNADTWSRINIGHLPVVTYVIDEIAASVSAQGYPSYIAVAYRAVRDALAAALGKGEVGLDLIAHDSQYFNPITAPAELYVRSSVIEKHDEMAGGYIIVDTRTAFADGRLVQFCRLTLQVTPNVDPISASSELAVEGERT